MSASSVVRTVDAKATLAHQRLAAALDRVVEDYWAVADALHEAHESEAWLRDDRAHEQRYRNLMDERGLDSIFLAYCADEFGLGQAYAGYVDVAGRLRAIVNPPTQVGGLDWSRFTITGVRPVSAAIVNTYDGADIAAALVTAQRLASAEVKTGHERAPVLGRHVRKALVEHGLVPPRARGVHELRGGERAAARLERAEGRVTSDVQALIDAERRDAVVALVVSSIRRLADDAAALAEIRAVLDEVTS